MEGSLQGSQQPVLIYSPGLVCTVPPSAGFLFAGFASVFSLKLSSWGHVKVKPPLSGKLWKLGCAVSAFEPSLVGSSSAGGRQTWTENLQPALLPGCASTELLCDRLSCSSQPAVLCRVNGGCYVGKLGIFWLLLEFTKRLHLEPTFVIRCDFMGRYCLVMQRAWDSSWHSNRG